MRHDTCKININNKQETEATTQQVIGNVSNSGVLVSGDLTQNNQEKTTMDNKTDEEKEKTEETIEDKENKEIELKRQELLLEMEKYTDKGVQWAAKYFSCELKAGLKRVETGLGEVKTGLGNVENRLSNVETRLGAIKGEFTIVLKETGIKAKAEQDSMSEYLTFKMIEQTERSKEATSGRVMSHTLINVFFFFFFFLKNEFK